MELFLEQWTVETVCGDATSHLSNLMIAHTKLKYLVTSFFIFSRSCSTMPSANLVEEAASVAAIFALPAWRLGLII